ncbi:TVP38/TMEM64 family inner membrane protein YdjZ [Bacillus sp. THAF10]|uniref:TVP38/TMEM64 family protein n=1 Tax=Bacillus sp. THAF10 TaxID=2587848 RepID=UPI001268A05C|nr:VTT domain-containing protein [Bacillus sp. THAF10]QFT87335.1 TVP38/TMEM64 family inner membrane protein YdjZ [Bacillus sp. THAF10]
MWRDYLIELFSASGPWIAVVISIVINTIISILAFVPSVFITAANLAFFGFLIGTLISFLGESIGAVVSFWLYRKGIKKFAPDALLKNKWLFRLQQTDGKNAFILVLALRLFPFAPSGLVTLAGATSKIGLGSFAVASTIGKIPALLIEAFSVYQVLQWNTPGKIILTLVAIALLIGAWKSRKKSDKA